MKSPLGICTWSLRNNPFDVIETLEATGLSHLHLDLVAAGLFRERIQAHGLTVSCTRLTFPEEDYSTRARIRETAGIGPDALWNQNKALALDGLERTAEMGAPFLSLHAGIIDSGDAERHALMCGRINGLTDAAQRLGVRLLLETGTEAATELRDFLNALNHAALGVNFNGANWILQGTGKPIDALPMLAPWILHMQIKDAVASNDATGRGTEVPWGTGEIGTPEFAAALDAISFTGVRAIERETGDQRIADLITTADLLKP